MKQTGEWVTKGAMAAALLMGVAVWGTGCGNDDEDSDTPDAVPSGPLATNLARYALAIGIDNYAPGYADPLLTCRNDARGFTGELAKDGTLWKTADKASPEGILVLTDTYATLSAIRARMQELANITQSGDLVVYFHSSHGGNHGSTDTYLCAYDANYEDTVFAQDLALFGDGVNVVVVIDACFSAGMFKGAPVFDFPQRVMRALERTCKAKSTKGPNVGWMASSEYTELSDAGPTILSYSRFTQYLIQGFVHGDADHNGNLTFKELFDYANPRTQPNHNPQSLNDALLGSLVAAAVDSGASGGRSGGSGASGGTATLRVVNQFIYDQTIFVDEVQVGVVAVGQAQTFTVTAGQHTIRAWDAERGSTQETVTFTEGTVETFRVVATDMAKAMTLAE